jgi:hypothetical protein
MVSRLLIVAIILIFNPACSTPTRDRDPLYSETIPNPAQDSAANGVAVSAGARLCAGSGGGHVGGGSGGGGHGGGGGHAGAIVAGAIVVVAVAALVANKIKKEPQDDRSSKAHPMPAHRSDPAILSP